MKLYEMKCNYITQKEIQGGIFSKVDAGNLNEFLHELDDKDRFYHIIVDDNPLHQKIISIDAVLDHTGRGIYVSTSVVLPGNPSGAPVWIETNSDSIWECTTDEPCRLFNSLIGMEIIGNIDCELIYDKGRGIESVSDILSQRYGYGKEEIASVADFSMYGGFTGKQ